MLEYYVKISFIFCWYDIKSYICDIVITSRRNNMNNVFKSEFLERSNNELQQAKLNFIEEEGLQEYLNSYECYLNTQYLTYTEIQKEMNEVCWNTIHQMQKNFQYN